MQLNQHGEVLGVVRRLRQLVDAEGPGKLLMCEVNGMEASVAYTAGCEGLHASYNFDLLFSGPPSAKRLAEILDSAGDMVGRAALVRRNPLGTHP
jgi:hypothetical protein